MLRLSISQVLALLVATSSLLAILVELDSENTVWRSHTLKYEPPAVPNEFLDHGRKSPSFLFGTLCGGSFESGPHLFSRQHKRGWAHFRSYFYENYSEFLGPRKIDLNGYHPLTKDEWTDEHWGYPYDLGYFQCSNQIQQLLNAYPESELRRKIGYPRYWHTVIYLAIFVIAISAVFFLKPSGG